MDQGLLQYIMFTPNERLPSMPNGLENEHHNQLGLDILNIITEHDLKVTMDERGIVHLTEKNS